MKPAVRALQIVAAAALLKCAAGLAALLTVELHLELVDDAWLLVVCSIVGVRLLAVAMPHFSALVALFGACYSWEPLRLAGLEPGSLPVEALLGAVVWAIALTHPKRLERHRGPALICTAAAIGVGASAWLPSAWIGGELAYWSLLVPVTSLGLLVLLLRLWAFRMAIWSRGWFVVIAAAPAAAYLLVEMVRGPASSRILILAVNIALSGAPIGVMAVTDRHRRMQSR